MKPDRILSCVLSVVVSLILSPIIGLIGGLVWYGVGGKNSGGSVAFIAGFVSFALLVWKLPGLLQQGLEIVRHRVPEPAYSCIEFGVAGAFSAGGLMVAAILLLGHMRPAGWNFDVILPVIMVGFSVFALIGWQVGLNRKRKI